MTVKEGVYFSKQKVFWKVNFPVKNESHYNLGEKLIFATWNCKLFCMWCRLLHLIHVCEKSFLNGYVEFFISEKFVTAAIQMSTFMYTIIVCRTIVIWAICQYLNCQIVKISIKIKENVENIDFSVFCFHIGFEWFEIWLQSKSGDFHQWHSQFQLM